MSPESSNAGEQWRVEHFHGITWAVRGPNTSEAEMMGMVSAVNLLNTLQAQLSALEDKAKELGITVREQRRQLSSKAEECQLLQALFDKRHNQWQEAERHLSSTREALEEIRQYAARIQDENWALIPVYGRAERALSPTPILPAAKEEAPSE